MEKGPRATIPGPATGMGVCAVPSIEYSSAPPGPIEVTFAEMLYVLSAQFSLIENVAAGQIGSSCRTLTSSNQKSRELNAIVRAASNWM